MRKLWHAVLWPLMWLLLTCVPPAVEPSPPPNPYLHHQRLREASPDMRPSAPSGGTAETETEPTPDTSLSKPSEPSDSGNRSGIEASEADDLVARDAMAVLPNETGRWPRGEPVMDRAWDDCVGKYIESLPLAARPPVSHALWVYRTTCDKVERRILFGPPRPVPAGRNYESKSYAMMAGQLANGRNKAWLRLQYMGWSWIFAQRVTVAADDYRWRSPVLTFQRDNYADEVWEIVDLPITRQLMPTLQKLVQAKDSVIRFEGDRTFADVIITREMKADIKLMMEALAAIGVP